MLLMKIKNHESTPDSYENAEIHSGYSTRASFILRIVCKIWTPTRKIDRFLTVEHIFNYRNIYWPTFTKQNNRAAALLVN